MGGQDAGVNHVDGDTRAGLVGVVVDAVKGEVALVNAVKAPGGASLAAVGGLVALLVVDGDDLVLLDGLENVGALGKAEDDALLGDDGGELERLLEVDKLDGANRLGEGLGTLERDVLAEEEVVAGQKKKKRIRNSWEG